MKISTRKITWMSTSCVFATLAGSPAIADDTELLLVSPDRSLRPTPNVMFILDTSGSMVTEQSTIDPYNSAVVYDAGDCDSSKFYWTDIDVIPDCATTQNIIDRDRYVCAFSRNQIAGIGSYTDTMIQYRDDGVDGSSSLWQTLAPGFASSYVECQADDGKHGDGTDDSRLWASSDTDTSNIFENDARKGVSWGSAPRNISYTVYSGNYLNWRSQPTNVVLSRSTIMKEVTKKVLSSVDNLNVGLMRFNSADGGNVILGLTDLDTNREAVLKTIDSLPAAGATPLSETLYENALYWRGMPAYYGQNTNETTTDPNALIQADPEIYRQPEWDVCAKNYNVLLTDGLPVEDLDTPGLVNNLPNFGSALGYAGCDGAGEGLCLDDIAQYLSVEDVDTLTDGEQLVTTHTIGFTIDLPILKETAENSGGSYFLADDVESLTKTLLSIIANINDLSLSFSAPAVSVNAFNRTQNLNDLYITVFGARARAHWPGNLKKYRIADNEIVDVNGVNAVDPTTGFFLSTARSYWTQGGADGNNVAIGGAAQQLPDPLTRNLYTNYSGNDLTSATNSVSTDNIPAFLESDFGLTGAEGEPTLAELIRWARGEDLLDADGNLATTVRKAMGDPLHSQPAAIIYGGTADSAEVVIYVATNDGYLHAIDGATGQELWSFIPKQLLKNLVRLYFDPRSKYKQYGLDGNIVPIVKDVDKDGIIETEDGDFVQIIFGMRRGGNRYFSLDVSDKSAPRVLWDVTFPEFGQSWSTPVVARMDIASVSQNADKAVVVIGGGYNVVHDTSAHPATPDGAGAGLHILDLRSGERLWRAGPDINANLQLASMTRVVPNEVRVIDLNGNGLADRMYATDLGGQILRFDIFNGEDPSALVTGGVIARLGAEGIDSPTAADTRRFYNSPDVTLITDNYQQRRYIAVNVGSGYRAHPFDLTAADRFFSVRDSEVFSKLPQDAYDNYVVATDADLVEVSGQTQVVITADDRGWKFTLPANQKILADSVTFNDQVFFVAFSPDSDAALTCSAGRGTNFLYRMSAVNGDPVVPNIDSLSPDLADDERRQTLQQGGIAPAPTILFPSGDDPDCEGGACNPPPLGCGGLQCFDPGVDNNPVRTLWTQDGIQ